MKPLEGVKVIEFSNWLAAPTVGRNLADWGADVIKVEPLNGDVWRTNGTAQNCPLIPNVVNPVFDNENLNKRWISVDTRSSEGMKVLLKLLETADVFITNYRHKALCQMGLDYDTLKQKYPSLVYAQVLGYGGKGPDAEKPGFDYTVFYARSGIMADLAPAGGPPVNAFTGMGDHTAAVCLTAGILAALYRKTVSGMGDYVSASLLQAACYVLGTPMMTGFYGTSLCIKREQAKQPFSNTFQGSDGEWLYLAAPNFARDFPKCCRLIGCEALINDPRCATLADAKKNIVEIVGIIDAAFKKKTRDEWFDIFTQADLPVERVQHIHETCNDPQALANNYIRKFTYSDGTDAIASGSPATFASFDDGAEEVRYSGPIGRDNDEVLSEYGYSAENIKELRDQGIIA